MKKARKLIDLLKSIHIQQKTGGQDLLKAYGKLSKITATELPDGFDDSDDIEPFLNTITDEEKSELGLKIERISMPRKPPRPLEPSSQPFCEIHIHAILCANDDGSGGASMSNAVDANYVKQLIDTTNIIYQDAGIQFIFDPDSDFEKVNSTLLNDEFTIPPNLNLNVPESQSPLDTDTTLGGQNNWRYCEKCEALFYAGHGGGKCPAGGSHQPGYGNYSLIHDRNHEGQNNWRYCRKCQGLYFAGYNAGKCSAGGSHQSGQANYSLIHDVPYGGQDNWRYCKKCQGLFYAGHSGGKCIGGGSHESGISNYRLFTQKQNLASPNVGERQRIGRKHRHKMLLLFCDGNMLKYNNDKKRWEIIERDYDYSSSEAEFVALGPVKWGNLIIHANHLAHESGHYFHLLHPFGWMPTTLEEAITLIKDYVEIHNHSIDEGLNIFDGDGLADTPPAVGTGLFKAVYGEEGACGSQGEIKIPVDFSDETTEEYILKPDRKNVMDYFKGCINFDMHFSQQQIAEIFKSLEEKNRWHLCHPSMRLRSLGIFVLNNQALYFAVWHPSEEQEIQVYDWTLKDLQIKYDELWPQGWRLKLLSPYVLNGQVRYTAVWKPSTEGEVQVYDWTQKDLRAKYDELWPQGWRLKLLSPYVVDGQVRYAAVWKPSTEGEIQVYDWTLKDLRAKYDRMW